MSLRKAPMQTTRGIFMFLNKNYQIILSLDFFFRMTILSSRSHTCIHPQVSRMSNKDDGCKKLNKKGQSILEMHTDIESSNDTMV